LSLRVEVVASFLVLGGRWLGSVFYVLALWNVAFRNVYTRVKVKLIATVDMISYSLHIFDHSRDKVLECLLAAEFRPRELRSTP